jgi:hypothetical protein
VISTRVSKTSSENLTDPINPTKNPAIITLRANLVCCEILNSVALEGRKRFIDWLLRKK